MLSQGTMTTLQNAVGATGNGSVLSVKGRAFAVFQILGSFSATVTWEGSMDGSNWTALAVANLGSTTRARATTATAAGLFLLDFIGGLDQVRARVSTYVSGNVTVVGRASDKWVAAASS